MEEDNERMQQEEEEEQDRLKDEEHKRIMQEDIERLRQARLKSEALEREREVSFFIAAPHTAPFLFNLSLILLYVSVPDCH